MNLKISEPMGYTLDPSQTLEDWLQHMVDVYTGKEEYDGENFLPVDCLIKIGEDSYLLVYAGELMPDHSRILDIIHQLPDEKKTLDSLQEIRMDEFERELTIIV